MAWKQLTLDVLKSSEIEGELLNTDQVRSSIARHLGIDAPGLIPPDQDVEKLPNVRQIPPLEISMIYYNRKY